MKRYLAFLLVFLCIFSLTGCTQTKKADVQNTLPPVVDPYTATNGDFYYAQTLPFTLVTPHFMTSYKQQEVMLPLNNLNDMDAVLDALLFSLPYEDKIKRLNSTVLSNGIATVNLSLSALKLQNHDLFALFQSIANTLCNLKNVEKVNVLVGNVSPGLDVGDTLPLGLFSKNLTDNPKTLYNRLLEERSLPFEQKNVHTIEGALYLPLKHAQGLIAQEKTLSFPSLEMDKIALSLLKEMEKSSFSHLPSLSFITSYLAKDPAFVQTKQRQIELVFDESVNNAIMEHDITRFYFVSSVVMTLTSFMPNLQAVSIKIGNEQISALTPPQNMVASSSMGFSDGFMRRSDFTPFVMQLYPLYFVDKAHNLVKTERALPPQISPRTLFEALIKGPEFSDTLPSLPVFPFESTEAHLLGVSRTKDTLLLNLSTDFKTHLEQCSKEEEKALVYALVNTMTDTFPVQNVRFYVEGTQPPLMGPTLCGLGNFIPTH